LILFTLGLRAHLGPQLTNNLTITTS